MHLVNVGPILMYPRKTRKFSQNKFQLFFPNGFEPLIIINQDFTINVWISKFGTLKMKNKKHFLWIKSKRMVLK